MACSDGDIQGGKIGRDKGRRRRFPPVVSFTHKYSPRNCRSGKAVAQCSDSGTRRAPGHTTKAPTAEVRVTLACAVSIGFGSRTDGEIALGLHSISHAISTTADQSLNRTPFPTARGGQILFCQELKG